MIRQLLTAPIALLGLAALLLAIVAFGPREFAARTHHRLSRSQLRALLVEALEHATESMTCNISDGSGQLLLALMVTKGPAEGPLIVSIQNSLDGTESSVALSDASTSADHVLAIIDTALSPDIVDAFSASFTGVGIRKRVV